MNSADSDSRALTPAQEEQFVRDGFVKVENAFSQSTAAECREILWRESGCSANDSSTWTRPVIRIGDRSEEPFREAANTPALHAAFDQLVGLSRWVPRQSLGGFPLRFPHSDDPGDTGWHIDASFPLEGAEANYMEWRVNLTSRGRALLMLFLFTDVGEQDGPTRIRVGSHLRVSKLLQQAGNEGLPFLQISAAAEQITSDLPGALASGPAGTVYLCHPFLVHAAQPVRGKHARFMAQPPLYPNGELNLKRTDRDYSPVERAVLLGLE
ncbi:phytanoyl-CoA dioxygenase family protein [Occallatibacter riparius]|uniref:Phytanoyl-CoA dioxygenase family protein n=1 Tax=Occallatibacter riparius TaxID=1002689 RepID=A0A9J7BMM3_9BACT|nr:phytanoyl-CoA dioxygenase family protein [Occallatibacter riparius]UWZ83984.1 phytanoyl-CoA dioxygenase family protein [Occallatibacter riparius]